MLLFYVRHGQPIYEPDSLTELGHRQADALVKRMTECKPDKIYASSSNRAILTAEPTAKALGKEIEILDWCNEQHAWDEIAVDYDDNKRTWAFYHKETRELFLTPEVRKLGKEWYRHPGLEQFEKGMTRIQRETDAFLLQLGYRHDHERNGYVPVKPNDDRIALFAHQGFGLAFMSCLLDIPYTQLSTHFDIGHSGLTVVEFKGEDLVVPKVLQWSNDSHIFAAGIPTDYQGVLHF
ncbi:MAG: histidine phosphatase family protein [Lachnospiraceae bacterium]|nr:histidine phosphatase family protein [Lachnospiraceae bacterium]